MRSIFFLLLLFLPFISSAQKFKAGLSAGISATQVSGDDLAGYNKAGVIFGAFTKRILSEKTAVEMEIIYIQKGSRKAARPDKGDMFFYLLNLNYVEVPVLFNYTKGKFTYEVGPSFGALVKSQVQNQEGFYPAGHPQNRPFNRMETSINAGITYPIHERFDMNWRISNSILPIRKHLSGAVYRFNRGQYNTVLQFNLRYRF